MSIWKLISELDFMAGPGMVDRPDYTSGERHGAKKNFMSMTGSAMGGGPANAADMLGQRAAGRGDGRGRSNVSGQNQPSSTYNKTWQQDEVHNAGPEEMERHGSPRNLWRDTPDGKRWTKMNHEGMGSPGRVGPFAPMNGPSMSSGRDAGPVEDEDGNPVSSAQIPPTYKDMSGPGNMWGGAGTIPGTTGGWANAPFRADDENDPEKNPMKLREFFDPSPIPVEEIDNPAQDHLKDQSDEDLEGKIDRNYGLESNDDFAEPPDSPIPDDDDEEMSLQAATMSISPPQGPGGLVQPGQSGGEVVDKASAWDVLKKVVDALGNSLNDSV